MNTGEAYRLWSMDIPKSAGDLVMAIHNNQVRQLIDSRGMPLVVLGL